MKLWNLTHNIVEATVYMNYHDTFMIMIIWTQHNMNCSCLSFKINLSWMWRDMKMCHQKTTSTSLSKYVKYELNYSIYLHENEIMKSSQLSWKILRKLLNWNQILIYNHLYLKNIMIWLMFLRDKTSTSCSHIRKNMILRLNWN